MKPLKDFEAFFNQKVKGDVVALESIRQAGQQGESDLKRQKRTLGFMLLFSALGGLGMVIFTIHMVTTYAPDKEYLIPIAAILFFFGSPLLVYLYGVWKFGSRWGQSPTGKSGFAQKSAAYQDAFAKLEQSFRDKDVIRRTAAFLLPDASYEKDRSIPQETVQSSLLMNHIWPTLKEYAGDDYFSGKVGATPFEMSEVRLAYMKKIRRDKSTIWVKAHEVGMFMALDFNKPFRGQTVVSPDMGQDRLAHSAISLLDGVSWVLGGLNRMLGRDENPWKDLEKVQLENPEFEALFDVRSSDPQQARYIFSPSFMDRLVTFHKKTAAVKTTEINEQDASKQVYLSFVGAKLFVYLDIGEMFAPDMDKPMGDFAPFEKYHQQLSLVETLVEDLNLNTQIW
ncbi:MAG: DUF3137 domain-containing protein, partial [Deltaproteobacteria bacterium]|nr:DUF3137 domain-containing protein [Deltaproteobacteria bacterium]